MRTDINNYKVNCSPITQHTIPSYFTCIDNLKKVNQSKLEEIKSKYIARKKASEENKRKCMICFKDYSDIILRDWHTLKKEAEAELTMEEDVFHNIQKQLTSQEEIFKKYKNGFEEKLERTKIILQKSFAKTK